MGVNEWLGVLTLLAVGVIVIYASITAGWNIVGIVIGLVFAGSSVLGTPQIRDFVHVTINSVRGRGGSKITQRDVSNSAVVGGDVYGDVIVNKPVDSPESSRQDREVKNILQGLIPFFTRV